LRVLVTGGAGFIGSHIVDALVERGHEVVVVDNLATGFIENVNPAAKFHKTNILEAELARLFEQERPQVVYHQAAQTVVSRSVAEPVFDAEQNILGGINVIFNCSRFGVSKIIYASSGGAIYGEPQNPCVSEEHPINPLAQYGVSKYTVERYLHLYHTQYGLNYTVLRYPNVYGQRQTPGGEAGVVAIFIDKMLRGEQPTIFGTGDKTRDYTHVHDIVAANLLALERGNNAAYNIGTGVETSDQEVFDTLARIVGYSGSPVYAAIRPGEIYRICLDAARAQRELGWQPRFSLEEGLRQTADYYRALFGQ